MENVVGNAGILQAVGTSNDGLAEKGSLALQDSPKARLDAAQKGDGWDKWGVRVFSVTVARNRGAPRLPGGKEGPTAPHGVW